MAVVHGESSHAFAKRRQLVLKIKYRSTIKILVAIINACAITDIIA